MTYDKELAVQLVDKYILIAITYINAEGVVESRQQLHGIVERTSKDEGIIVQLCGTFAGEKLQLPADTSSFAVAEQGVYTLSTTQEELENPDYVCAFDVHKPPQE